MNHSYVECTSLEGEGINLHVKITYKSSAVLSKPVPSIPKLISYSPPTILSVTPNHGVAIGKIPINVYGSSFGIYPPIVKVGNDFCRYISHMVKLYHTKSYLFL